MSALRVDVVAGNDAKDNRGDDDEVEGPPVNEAPAVEEAASVARNAVPPEMELTEEEHQWAVDIKNAIERTADLPKFSDMMYCQLAIVGQGDVEWALKRAYKLQALREEYRILDTYEQGERQLRLFMEYFPGMILSVSHYERAGNQVGIFDITKFEMKVWRDPDKLEVTMGACYYLVTMLCPDFQTIRNGVVKLIECQGYSRGHDMIDITMLSKLFYEVNGSYPLRFAIIKFFHSPVMFNVVISMLKRTIPSEIFDKFQIGCLTVDRLDALYLVPTPEVASERIMCEMKCVLRRRYKNENSFSL